MTLAGEWTSYRRLRAPQDDGSRLVEPPLTEIAPVLQSNRAALSADYDMQGRSLSDLRQDARCSLLAAAQAHVAQYAHVLHRSFDDDAPVFLTGHQPQLFHPGVWLKNFLAGHLAQQHGGVAVHVIIDADLLAAPSIRVPSGSVKTPRWQTIEFDASAERMPAEERSLVDNDRFASFGQRIQDALAPLVDDPLVANFWPRVMEQRQTTRNIGQCFARARHALELDWGSATLEVPQSTVCSFDAFRWLVVHLLTDLPRLWQIHNDALTKYRASHRIRTPAQPLPDLRADDDWLESPFWIWSADAPTRRPLWVRTHGKQLTLSDRASAEHTLDTTLDSAGATAVEQLAELESQGVKIRPRALLNTLYCRLLLSDLFIHGIGGAKYDQLTDEIISGFFGLEPPVYCVATGTLRLPVERPAVDVNDARALAQELRRMTYHPETFVDQHARNQPDIAHWIEQKRTWVETEQTRDNARERYLAIRSANAALQPVLENHRTATLRHQIEVSAALRADALLGSREWSFCLHEEESLREFLAFDV